MSHFNRRQILAAGAATGAAAALGIKPSYAQADYPSRPVTVICPWGAGGGTDATARIIAALLEKDLGQPFNVVNRGWLRRRRTLGDRNRVTAIPGDGHSRDHDASPEIDGAHPGTHAPGVMNGSARHSGEGGQPYKDVRSWRMPSVEPPGTFKASGTGQGGIWHLALSAGCWPWISSRITCPGCPRTVPRLQCRTWPPVAWTSSRARFLRRRRCSMPSRRDHSP